MTQPQKRNRHEKRRQRRLAKDRVIQRVQHTYSESKFTVQNSHDGVKMSVILEKFVEPFTQVDDSLDLRKNMYNLAIIAWNTSVLMETKGENLLKKTLKLLPPGERPIAKEMILTLQKRKKEHFRGINRLILDYELIEDDHEAYLSVVSSHPFS